MLEVEFWHASDATMMNDLLFTASLIIQAPTPLPAKS